MTNSGEKIKPKLDVESILADFGAREKRLGDFCEKTTALIKVILEDAGIRYYSIQQRVKEKESLRQKYLDPTKDYRTLDDITDLAGLRVITYYDDDMDRAAEVIRREFSIDLENSVDKRDGEPDRFGYSALNFVCGHSKKRVTDVEYKKFLDVRCEIQITSILRHAWSEIEHDWYDLKDAYPKEVKRRFYRLAALLEIAESEFRDLRNSKTQYKRSVEVQVGANVPDLPVNAVSLKSFIEQEPLVEEIDRSIASLWGVGVSKALPDKLVELMSGVANLAGMVSLSNLRDSLTKYRAGILEYVQRCRKFWPEPPSSAPVGKGISIINLAMMLISVRGVDAILEAHKPFRPVVTWDLAQQVTIAKDIVAKYGAPR